MVAGIALVGCVGSQAEERSANLAESCSGFYECLGPGGYFETELFPTGVACDMADTWLLLPDGSVETPEDNAFQIEGFRWSGDSAKFSVCYDGGGCITCTNPDFEDDGAESTYEGDPSDDDCYDYEWVYECTFDGFSGRQKCRYDYDMTWVC